MVGPEEIDARWPDCLLILAWNFADAIIERHQDYLAGGGEFLVPLPELRTVRTKPSR